MSRFTEWSQKAVTSPARWTKPKPVTRVTVRLMATVAGQHRVRIEAGEPGSITGINRTSIRYPDPIDDHGYPTDACRAFITEAVRDAVRRDRYMRWIHWADGATTACTSRYLPPVTTSPSSSLVFKPGIVIKAEPTMQDRDPNIVHSGLSRTVTMQGASVEVMIYRLEHDPKWALEVVNDAKTSTVWDNLFDTDEEAFAAFELTLRDEGIDAFLDRSNVIEFPRRH